MKAEQYTKYRNFLRTELVTAQGCTEPIAVAYAAAKAREALGEIPEKLELRCSGNIIKNVMGVIIPHSGGRRGVDTAAILGAIGGDASRKLEVLENVNEEHRERLDDLLSAGYCRCSVADGTEKLFISVRALTGTHWAQVDIESAHTNITRILRDGEIIFLQPDEEKKKSDKSALNLEDILQYADTEEVDVLRELLEPQMRLNTAIAEEGLKNSYGAQVGRTILKQNPEDSRIRSIAMAAAASDARMGGCPLPVVINSGSGNQGITASVPVAEYARRNGVPEEKMYRALAISNLTALLQKRYIGSLSAYCGVVCAACGAGAAMTYLRGGDRQAIENTVSNTLGTISGMICDGAKSSCAAKIAAALWAAAMAGEMSIMGRAFQPGEGIVCSDAEKTIRAAGRVGSEGMRKTDEVVLRIMLDRGR